MDKKDFAFGKMNYLICIAAVVLVFVGFCLMTGPASSIEGGFEPDIFSTRRIVVAPMVVFAGFLIMIVGILFNPDKEKKNKLEETSNSQDIN